MRNRRLNRLLAGCIARFDNRRPRVIPDVKRPARHGDKTIAISSICISTIAIFLGPILVSSLLLRYDHELSKRTICQCYMHDIYQAMCAYAEQNRGAFPEAGADWKARLLADDALSPKTFVCPSTRDVPGGCSYVYVPGYGCKSDPNQIVLYERPENHHGDGGNVLYKDGRAVFWKSPQYQELIKAIRLPDGSPLRP